ncbi:MAG: Photosystem I reaction center subunit III [Symploca sp. SIO1B1]|nr:Photosystem I reaction center subunit III [Symploca sp. SIO2D2]NER22972.1 Photosystem I reaction center subunit III [Symploca sp. SIO1C2]NER51501.1 Photosystem I reaction center subunit III [Symploca sp. SIO1A3]NER95945.1 Photosystem I reaction center subunit III [Symploca sp. SIO1B1]
MRRLLALVFAVVLWFSCATAASAEGVAGLTPCKDSPAFQERAEDAVNTTGDPESGKKRFERYSEALCGEEGLPHLIVDGRLSHAGDFIIPSLLFLYITGWIGWVGRSYLQTIKEGKNPEEKEIVIDVPLAISKMLFGFSWPLAAFGEYTSGKMFAKDDEIPISPR